MSDAPGIPTFAVEHDNPAAPPAPAEADLLDGPEDEDIAKVLSMDPEAKARRRIQRVRATRSDKLASLFGDGRRYRIVKEVSVEASAKFTTPMGNRGRRGYVVRQEAGPPVVFDFPANAVHKYLDNGMVTFVVGKTLLKHAAEAYQAVVDWVIDPEDGPDDEDADTDG